MGKLLCEKTLRDVWCRNESVRAEIGPILQTHTHTRVSYSSIDSCVQPVINIDFILVTVIVFMLTENVDCILVSDIGKLS